MNRPRILLAVLLLLNAALWHSQHSGANVSAIVRSTPAPETGSVQHPGTPSEHDQFNRQIEERVQRISTLERAAARLEQMRAASAETDTYRRQAQATAFMAWQQVLATNQAGYAKLLEQARASANGEVPCTICDGFSYMPCVMCPHHDGKCVTCKGSGQLTGDAICPACLGSGKCYLCTGSGKMFCPYCDDGTIQARRPPPAAFPPIH